MELFFPPDWLKKNPDPEKYLPAVTEKASTESINKQTIALDKWFKTGVYSSLPGINQDLLLITGTEDILTPPQNSFIIGEKVNGCWVVQIKGGGHGVIYQYPKDFTDIVLTFLQ